MSLEREQDNSLPDEPHQPFTGGPQLALVLGHLVLDQVLEYVGLFRGLGVPRSDFLLTHDDRQRDQLASTVTKRVDQSGDFVD